MSCHVCYSVSEGCIEPQAMAYGTCYGCNACGRINKETMTQDAIRMYEGYLKEQINFSNWHEGFEELQNKNRLKNIEYFEKLISDLKEKLK